MDFDASTVAIADITADSNIKDASLAVPTTETSAVESKTPVVEQIGELEDDCAIKRNFTPRPIRNNQPFSPESNDASDLSVVESEADTLAAQTPNNPSSEVEVDLISQFERLVLNKNNPVETVAVPTVTEHQIVEPGEPATVTPSLDISVSSAVLGLKEGGEEEEVSAPTTSTQLNETVSISAKTVEETVPNAEDQEEKENNNQSDIKEVIEEVAEEQVVDESIAPPPAEVLSSSTTVAISVPVDEDCSVTPEDISLPCNDQTVITVNEQIPVVQEPSTAESQENDSKAEEQTVQKPHQLGGGNRKALALPEDKPIVPKKGYDLSFLDRFDNLENATPSISQAKLPAGTPTNNNNTIQLQGIYFFILLSHWNVNWLFSLSIASFGMLFELLLFFFM